MMSNIIRPLTLPEIFSPTLPAISVYVKQLFLSQNVQIGAVNVFSPPNLIMLFELNYPSLNGYEQLKFIFLLVLYPSVYGVLV
jgi:hypothetical protein